MTSRARGGLRLARRSRARDPTSERGADHRAQSPSKIVRFCAMDAAPVGTEALSPEFPANAREAVFSAEPASVGPARTAARTFCVEHGASPTTCSDVALAVTEAAANAVVHAF